MCKIAKLGGDGVRMWLPRLVFFHHTSKKEKEDGMERDQKLL